MCFRLVKQQSNSVKIVPRYGQELLDRIRDRKGVELRTSICQPALRNWCRERCFAPFLDPLDPPHQDTEPPLRELLVIICPHDRNIDDKSRPRVFPQPALVRRSICATLYPAAPRGNPRRANDHRASGRTPQELALTSSKPAPRLQSHSSARNRARRAGNAADGH